MSKIGKRLIGAAQEARAIARGELAPAHVHTPEEFDVKSIRSKVKMSQDQFAWVFGFSTNQIKDWEQGRSRPLNGNRTLLLLIDQHPQAVISILEEAATTRASHDHEEPIAQAM